MVEKKQAVEFKKIVRENNTFFLTLHINPDADACGSMLSVYRYLIANKKRVYLYSSDKIQENLQILPYINKIKNIIVNRSYDVGIFFECSVPERAGEEVKSINFKKKISIDHHRTAKRYADLNILDFNSPSTAEIVFDLFEKINFKIDRNIALLLYAGIVTDTGRFHYPQTRPQTHIIASKLISYGFNFSKLNDNFFLKTTYKNLKLLARALESMQLYYNNKVAVMSLKISDFKEFNAGFEHTESIVNYPMMMESTLVSIFIKEDQNKYTVTFRSKDDIDVSRVAITFGGGGHKNASGFKISKDKITFKDLLERLLIEIKKSI